MQKSKGMTLLESIGKVLLPQTGTEKLFYVLDILGIGAVTVSRLAYIEEWLGVYVLGITAMTITITLVVKLYNLFTPDDKNKKI